MTRIYRYFKQLTSDGMQKFLPHFSPDGSFCNSRVDKIRADGSGRTRVTDGGPDCTPPGKEAIGAFLAV